MIVACCTNWVSKYKADIKDCSGNTPLRCSRQRKGHVKYGQLLDAAEHSVDAIDELYGTLRSPTVSNTKPATVTHNIISTTIYNIFL